LAVKSISERKRIRYLLGLSSAAERERIESEYFEDDRAFQKMLTAEDDLIDAYARGELADDERRRFEKRFASSLSGTDRIRFARAFAGAASDSRPVETKLTAPFFKTLNSPGLLRIAAVIVLVAFLVWLVTDRWRMTNELRELRAESAELSKQFEVLQRSSDTERAQLTDLRAQPDKPTQGVTTATQRLGHLPGKYAPEKFALREHEPTEKLVNTQDATLSNTFVSKQIAQLPLEAPNVASLLTLQPGGGYVAGSRADQSDITLDGVDLNMSTTGGSTVRGTARDPQGNLVSGATVTLTNSDRHFTRTQTTNNDGAYVFNAVPPGTYSLKVQARGFKTASASDLIALVDTSTVRDVQLEIGAVSETVDVTSAAEAAINASDPTLGNSFEGKRITELPLNANNVGLLSLQPGVTRTDQSNITLDSIGATIRIPSFLSWIRFQIALKTTAIHEDYRVTIKTTDGRPVTSVNWVEPLTPNQTIVDTPAISTSDLPSGDYILLLMGKEPDGSFIKVAEYFFKVFKY
jgi:hypothetical protein